MAGMQGMNMRQIYDRIADVLWDTQVAQWSFVSESAEHHYLIIANACRSLTVFVFCIVVDSGSAS